VYRIKYGECIHTVAVPSYAYGLELDRNARTKAGEWSILRRERCWCWLASKHMATFLVVVHFAATCLCVFECRDVACWARCNGNVTHCVRKKGVSVFSSWKVSFLPCAEWYAANWALKYVYCRKVFLLLPQWNTKYWNFEKRHLSRF
jgi:hypothetical protein